MIDTTKAKADAEEGLRIAEKATEGPWEYGPRTQLVFQADALDDLTICDLSSDTHCNNGPFIVDSRTRAPNAYRNVIALAEEVERLRAEAERWRRDAIEDAPSREVLVDIRALLGITKGQSTIAAISTIVAELARLAPLDEAVRRQRERDEAIEQGSR